MTEINYLNILKRIKPKEKEKKKIYSLSNLLMDIINEKARELGIDAEAVLVGSVAKGTWISGKADVDIFIKFPIDTPLETLKEKGLYLGEQCIKKIKGRYEFRYASHPYITGITENYTIDFVPCYDITDIKQMKSAVDRTIAHTEYVKENLTPEEADEVLLLKSFMRNIGTYGSEFKVGGFAGYLCELLIIHYKTFIKVLECASTQWKPGYQIDIAEHGTASVFDDPLVVVDPVDENRNVASALSLQKMSEFVVASRNFLKNPSESYFDHIEPTVDLNDIKNEFKNRGTKVILLSFKAPDIPADALYPQIKKTENSIVRMVKRNGFMIFGSDSWTDEKNEIIILVEFETWKLPIIKKHYGPPIWSKSHEEKFLEKYKYKVWLEEDRWVAGVRREHTNARNLIETALSGDEKVFIKFGKHIKASILEEHELYDLQEFLNSEGIKKNILVFLNSYLHKSYLLWGKINYKNNGNEL